MLPERSEGDDAFARIYALERAKVVRLAYLIVRSPAEAEELAQEAFLRLHGEAGSVHNPHGFLRTVVVRLAISAVRHREVERRRMLLVRPPAEVPADEIDETWHAIGRLRHDRATVLVLRFYEDLSHEEIGRILHCPAATVRSRVRRALADLREELTR